MTSFVIVFCYVIVEASSDEPFYRQWWFLVIVALLGVIFIIIVVSVLCLTGLRRKEKYKGKNLTFKCRKSMYVYLIIFLHIFCVIFRHHISADYSAVK